MGGSCEASDGEEKIRTARKPSAYWRRREEESRWSIGLTSDNEQT